MALTALTVQGGGKRRGGIGSVTSYLETLILRNGGKMPKKDGGAPCQTTRHYELPAPPELTADEVQDLGDRAAAELAEQKDAAHDAIRETYAQSRL